MFAVDDDLECSPKFEELDKLPGHRRARAFEAWLRLGAACRKRGNGGLVTPFLLSKVLGSWAPKEREQTIFDLVNATAGRHQGLLITVAEGWQFHEWETWQPTSEEAAAERQSRGKSAERMRRLRMKRRNGDADEASHVTPSDASQPSVTSDVTLARARVSVPSRPVPSPSVVTSDASLEPEPSDLRDTIRRRWAQTYERARGQIPIAADTESIRALIPVLEANAPTRGEAPAALFEHILAAYWREPWPRQHANRASLANLVRQFDRLLGGLGEPQRVEAFDPSKHTPKTLDEERAVNDWIAAGCPAHRRTA